MTLIVGNAQSLASSGRLLDRDDWPLESEVAVGVTFGPNDEFTGTAAAAAEDYPDEGDVRRGTLYNSDTQEGTLYVPPTAGGCAGMYGLTCNVLRLTSLDAWATGTAYVIGDVVAIDGNATAYVALTNHTSDAWATDLAAEEWEVDDSIDIFEAQAYGHAAKYWATLTSGLACMRQTTPSSASIMDVPVVAGHTVFIKGDADVTFLDRLEVDDEVFDVKDVRKPMRGRIVDYTAVYCDEVKG